MKLLANENSPLRGVLALRDAGHDVASITEISPGIRDEDVLQRARNEGRVVVTFDRDYGELLFRHQLPRPKGVFYLRFTPADSLEIANYLIGLLNSGIELEDRYTTADRDRVRQRPLSPGGIRLS